MPPITTLLASASATLFRKTTLSRASLLLVAAVIATHASADLTGQSPSQSSAPQRPVFRTEANYVRVDVFPTMNDKPVDGLRQEDFEILDNNVPQRIEQFEHVTVTGGGPQDARREPNTVGESRQAISDPRARVFVIFLDFYHVEPGASRNLREPLVNALDRLMGDDDLVAVMTPEMSASDITFARKTTTINGILTRHWNWGERGQLISVDPEEEQYRACYPGVGCNSDAGVAEELIERRREKRTLDALQNLVEFLRVWREERKAILVVSDGWRLFTPNSALTRQSCRPPAFPKVRIDPRTGKPTTTEDNGDVTAAACDRDRLSLSQIDDERAFRDLLNDANRSNASFYPIDPRGLVTFDEPLVKLNPSGGPPSPVLPPSVNAAALQARVDTLRRAAGGTDGLAVVATNDLDAGLRRIVSDLSSYYLLGYYSTVKLDGKYHAITVRVKRPGVQVRARRGYLAATAADLVAASKPAPTSSASGTGTVASAAAVAIAGLASSTRDATLKVHVVAGWAPGTDGGPRPMFWAVGEVGDPKSDSQVDVAVTGTNGELIATMRGRIPAGSLSTLLTLVPTGSVAAGQYSVRVRTQGTVDSETSQTSVTLQSAPNASGAVLMRRGPTTGNRDVPTADLRFRRADQLRLDLPVVEVGTVTARLLDRTGQPLNLPINTTIRQDPDGTRWTMARLALAPLAPGDYLVELSPQKEGTESRMLVAFRVVP